MDKKMALYIFFADNRLQKMDSIMGDIDLKNKDADGFLYGVFTT